MKKNGILILLLVGLFLPTGCIATTASDKDENDLEYCREQLEKSLSHLTSGDTTDYSLMPRNIAPGDSLWSCRKACAEEWCSGFWSGILWYGYEYTGDEILKSAARRYSQELKPIVEAPAYDHDLGFLIFCSYGNGYRLTGDSEYKQVILNAADSLATLFNPAVGTICSWPRNEEMLGGHNTIMDNMINLEMLLWASKNGGSSRLYDIAVSHADVTMANHFRPDYTSYHVAVYDKNSGEFIRGCTHQGFSDDSMWARGQAWAVYGYTVMYRETGDEKYLSFVKKVADAYLSKLPADRIPYWDFNVPQDETSPRDVSAACIVASALVELSTLTRDEESAYYLDEAKKMLASLRSEPYRSGDTNDSFLLHSTGHHPAGSEIDYSIIYADYYYIEALMRLKNLEA